MPDCGHKGAVCVVGNFWTCKVTGCTNGPKAEVKEARDGAFEKLKRLAWKQSEVEKALRDQFYQLSFPMPDDWDDGQKTPVTVRCSAVMANCAPLKKGDMKCRYCGEDLW